MTGKKTKPIETRLRTLIDDSHTSLQDIAEGSGVPYQSLQRWYSGRNKSIKLDHGEQIWEYLTGQKFQ